MFNIEEWQADGWAVVRRDVPEDERDDLMAGNLASGNINSDTAPAETPAEGTVFRFVEVVP